MWRLAASWACALLSRHPRHCLSLSVLNTRSVRRRFGYNISARVLTGQFLACLVLCTSTMGKSSIALAFAVDVISTVSTRFTDHQELLALAGMSSGLSER